MKETLYTIPVNDAFATDCECPICQMKKEIENDAIAFTMGPSYMEDDIRLKTDKIGFCSDHIKKLYDHQNRLGLALMLNTHLLHTIKQIEKNANKGIKAPSLFKKTTGTDPLIKALDDINHSCYICERVNGTFERYIATIFHLYRTDSDFPSKLKKCKGFCNEHFSLLYNSASSHLGGKDYEEFLKTIVTCHLENLKRIQEDLEWFTDKFDYRNTDAPWKNSKDALPRTILKTNHTFLDL